MGILKNIYWDGADKNTIVYKFDVKNDQVNRGSMLTVREGQAAIFCHRGQMADVFLPGAYKLDTNSIPLLTKLMSWKYGFENAVRVDIYFVNMHQFTNFKWGTVNPILVRDNDFGAVEIRGYGTYAFRVDDPYVFMQELSGSHPTFRTNEIIDMLRSRVISGLTDAIGESKVPILDMAGNVMELAKEVVNSMQPDFKSIGIQLTNFTFENFSMPEDLQQALRDQTKLGLRRKNLDIEVTLAQAEAMKAAAANPGGGGPMSAMMGMGMGAAMGNMMGGMMGGITSPMTGGAGAAQAACAHCGKPMAAGAKFCPSCGKPSGAVCPHCSASVTPGAKFCPSCGKSLQAECPSCKKPVPAGTKFCPECGNKI